MSGTQHQVGDLMPLTWVGRRDRGSGCGPLHGPTGRDPEGNANRGADDAEKSLSLTSLLFRLSSGRRSAHKLIKLRTRPY